MLDDFLTFSPLKLSAEVKKRTPAAVEMALRLEDLERAHLELDRIGIPRMIAGETASLTARVAYLDGLFASATMYIAHLNDGQVLPHPHPLPVVEGAERRVR